MKTRNCAYWGGKSKERAIRNRLSSGKLIRPLSEKGTGEDDREKGG